MNNYKLFLLDGADYAELDVEGVDFSTTFSVADIADISQRKDSISKNIKLKSTKNNNRIFGSLYNINRHTESNINQNLFVNYKPSHKVDCLVYENETLILKGQLQVIAFKNAAYEAIITGSIVNFFGLLGDLKLSNLDFNEYSHNCTDVNILNSLNTSIIRSGATIPFEVGSGYVYPFIIYKAVDGASNSNKVYSDNFRPAIYVNEYFKKIFNQPSLSGFTYEIKGDSMFKSEFNSLIIPNNEEQLESSKLNIFNLNKGSQSYPAGVWKDLPSTETGFWFVFNQITPIEFFVPEMQWTINGGQYGVWKSNDNIKIDGTANASINLNYQTSIDPIEAGREVTVRLELVARDYIPNNNPSNNPLDDNFYNFKSFTVLAQDTKVIYAPLNQQNLAFNFDFVDVQLKANQQFGLRVMLYNVSYQQAANWFSGNSAQLKINKATYDFRFGDLVKPKPPLEITQKDFIKSILKMYNLYVYSNIENPKHIIFEKYDDFYFKSNNLIDSVDWSNKIDYNQDLNLIMNIESDKKYTFSYKEDSDYFNSLYKKRYNTTYGNFNTGEQEEEKIELIFSPTPIFKTTETNRVAPFIYNLDSNNVTAKVKSNVRILYYNGVKTCAPYTIVDKNNNGVAPSINKYGNCSHLKYQSGDTNYNLVSDLNFGLCKEYFTQVDSSILTIPNLFSNYKNLIGELNNPNFLTVECDVLLNEVDISNLDFKTPIYISTPSGDGYFKLLEVTYFNSNELSQVKLQKIII